MVGGTYLWDTPILFWGCRNSGCLRAFCRTSMECSNPILPPHPILWSQRRKDVEFPYTMLSLTGCFIFGGWDSSCLPHFPIVAKHSLQMSFFFLGCYTFKRQQLSQLARRHWRQVYPFCKAQGDERGGRSFQILGIWVSNMNISHDFMIEQWQKLGETLDLWSKNGELRNFGFIQDAQF